MSNIAQITNLNLKIMKKIVLGIVFLCAVSFAFAGNDFEDSSLINDKENITEVIFFTESGSQSEQFTYAENYLITLEMDSTIDSYPCRWRYCITRNGVKYCTEWEYGECLSEVQL